MIILISFHLGGSVGWVRPRPFRCGRELVWGVSLPAAPCLVGRVVLLVVRRSRGSRAVDRRRRRPRVLLHRRGRRLMAAGLMAAAAVLLVVGGRRRGRPSAALGAGAHLADGGRARQRPGLTPATVARTTPRGRGGRLAHVAAKKTQSIECKIVILPFGHSSGTIWAKSYASFQLYN